ncbi:hypothetical protein JTE90_001089 [Oedothorax gibbosus]|uniref:RING-type domain-containing protein n=1 Tax=Oedothorax gibbosus TaxID=931172 RepID=A0AAV6UJ25_9ARAC|nr:hypothetical protein JTE90_001089 [Oedothorax gibbosus]
MPSFIANLSLEQSIGTYVKMIRFEDLFHLPDCNEHSCCLCTRTLLARGIYKIRFEIQGQHLTCGTNTRHEQTVLLEQYTWPRLHPYDFDKLERALRTCVEDCDLYNRDDQLDEESEQFSTFEELEGAIIAFFNSNASDESEEEDLLSSESIKALPSLEILEDGLDCSVCLQRLELHTRATQLPCNHVYHETCIGPWLEMRASCPTCREKVVVDMENCELCCLKSYFGHFLKKRYCVV